MEFPHTKKIKKVTLTKQLLHFYQKAGGNQNPLRNSRFFFYRATPYKSLSQFVFENLTHFAPVLAGKIVEN